MNANLSKIIITLLCLFIVNSALATPVVSYGDASITPKSEYFTLKINGEEVFVNNHTVTGNHFSWFSHSGSAEYEITYHKENINEYRISPMRLNIPSTQVGNTIRFTVDKPTKLILQVNYPLVDNMKHSRTHNKNMLFLYADEPEVNPPKPGDPNVIVSGSNINSTINSASKNAIIYIPKGTYNQQVRISKSDITLYLAPGANIVNTYVNPKKNDHLDQEEVIYFLYNTNNVTIKGRGFLQGNGDLLRPRNSSDFILEDLVLLNNGSHRMGIVFWGEDLDNLTVRNTKVLTDAADGIDPVGCRNCLIEKNIVYSADDAIVIKERYRTTYNVTVKNNIAWSYNANALKIGGHFFKLAPVNGINFIDNDAIYEGTVIPNGFNIASNTRNGFGDISSTITNTYNENLKGILDSYSYYYNDGNGIRWSGKVRLSINNMRIRKARAGNHGIRIESESDPSKVDAIVTFNNLWIQDRYITSKQDLIDLGYNPFYPNVTIDFNVSSNPVNPDNESPSKPEKLTASERTPTSVKLNWIASTDNIGVEKYEVHYNNKIKTVIGTSTTLIDLTPNLNPPITVRALDIAGNHSNFSDPAIETDTSDTVAPNIPTGLKLDSVRDTAAYISWSTSTDGIGIVSGYRIFRDNVEIGTSITTSYSDYTVQVQRNYNYTVTAFDVSGNESQQSSPFSVSIPASGVVDTIAPSIPTDLTLNDATSNEVSISWTASLDDIRFVALYHIMRDGSEIGTSTTTSYTDNTASAGGTYNYTVTAEDNSGNESLSSNGLTVEVGNPILTAVISANQSSGIVPLLVNFDASASTDPDGTIESYSWNYGDNNLDTGVFTSHIFDTVGIYNSTLTVTNNEGASDTTTIQIVVNEVGSSPPTAVISANPLSGIAPLTVDFDASASSDLDGSIISYNWNFGDGSNDTGINPSHPFDTAGTYNVSLTVTDNSGNTDTESITITVDPEPNSCVFASGNGVSNGSFEDSLNDWIYHNNGSGTASVSNVDSQHCDYVAKLDFNATGSNVQLYQQTVSLDAATDYTFSFTAKASTPRTIKIYLHKHTSPYNSYGINGFTVNLTTEWKTYTYDFKSQGFTGSVNNGRLRFWLVTAQPGDTMLFDNIIIQKQGIEPPVPVAPSIQIQPQDVSAFTGQSAIFSVSAQGTAPLQYQWQRDGLDIAGANSASYSTDSLSLADDGASFSVDISNSVASVSSNAVQLTVSVPPNQEPVASFVANNTTGIAPLTVTFDATASTDSDGSISDYSWDFGDGNTSTGITTDYTFDTPGVFDVMLTVTDDEGEINSTIVQISVSEFGNQLPTAIFSATPQSGVVPLAVDFDASASTDPDNDIVTYNWIFGDGNIGTGETTSHLYNTAGIYTVILTVTDNNGNVNSESTTVTVDPEPNSCVFAISNGVSNGSFEDSLNDWVYHNNGSGTASVSNIDPQHCDYVAKLDFNAAGSNVQLYQQTVALDAATDYTFSFVAKASTPRSIKVYLHKHTAPYSNYGINGFTANLTTEWQTFSYNFKSKGFTGSVNNGRLRFWLTTAQPGDTMFFDDIIIKEEDSEPTNQLPTAVFSANPLSGIAPLTVDFDASASSDPDGSITSYNWSFDDGSSDASINPSHIFNSAGTYEITLTVIDDDNASDVEVIQITVSDSVSNQLPTAAFTADPLSGIAPLTVNFDASTSTDADGTIMSYNWNFGDGNTVTGIDPSHIFDIAGTYDVTLTIIDDDGASDIETIQITVSDDLSNQLPTATFSANPLSGIAPLTVDFDASASSDPDGSITSYNWSFDDGSSDASINPSHIFNSAGTYEITLTVIDDDNASDVEVIQITVSDSVSNQLPTAAFTADPLSGIAPLTVNFDASTSTDADGTIMSYNWNFGDGNTVTGIDPSHIFDIAGTYDVTLTIIDDDGASDIETIQITVSDDLSNQLPTATFSANPLSGIAPLTVDFDASASSDPDGSITSYNWSFDDGSSDASINPSHIFNSAGTYEITLTVIDDDNASDVEVIQITVSDSVSNQLPTAAFTADPLSGIAPLTVNFDASTSTDADGTIMSYNWNFGDGNTVTGIDPSHIFDIAGTYDVTLTIIDDDGASDIETIQITVSDDLSNQLPTATFSANPLSGIAPLTVDFDASASSDLDGSIISYNWNFGDGSNDTGINPSHPFDTAGTYNVSLTVTDNSGNTDTESITITVDPEPNSCVFASGNGVSNGSFEDSLNDWIYHNNGSGTASVSNVDSQHCDYVAKLDFNATGSNVQLYQQTVSLDAATDYTFSFTAKASTPRTIKIYLHKHTSPYNSYGINGFTVNLTTEWKTYTYDFKSQGFTGSVNNGRLRFWLVTAQPGDTMLFDNIIIQKQGIEPPVPVAPSIQIQPQDVSAFTGQSAIFSVSAQGTAPLQYQWQRDGLDIAGANSASYSTDSLSLADDGASFSVDISNSVASVSSNAVQLTVSVPPNQEPVASFVANNTTGIAPLTVTFDATASTDSDGSISDYSWDFGDGNTSTGITTDYTFDTPGVFDVMLTVTDDEGEINSTIVQISVSEFGNQLPTAIFSATPQSGVVPLAVDFDASASTDPDNDIVTYNWIFGDGNIGTGETTSHLYNTAGIYTVILTVTDNNGNANSESTTVTVDPEPNSCVFAISNGVSNGSFEDSLNDWVYHNNGSGTASVSNIDPQHCDYVAKLDFNAAGSNVQLYQQTVALDAATDYTFSFVAKASTPRSIKVYLHKHTAPYSNYGINGFTANLTTEWQTFSYNFKSKGFTGSVNNGRLRFWLTTAQPGDTMFFDDIIIKEN